MVALRRVPALGKPPRVITFEQFYLASGNTMESERRNRSIPDESAMPLTIHVGTILMKQWPGMPPLIGFESEPGLGEWSIVKASPDAFTLDRNIHAAGWNLFFIAAEVKAMFFGSLTAAKVGSALKRILAKVNRQHFNGFEITAIVARHFLGIPYVTVSAHSRHLQQSCYLESTEKRRSFQHDSEWARS